MSDSTYSLFFFNLIIYKLPHILRLLVHKNSEVCNVPREADYTMLEDNRPAV